MKALNPAVFRRVAIMLAIAAASMVALAVSAPNMAGKWKPDNSETHERAGTDCCSTLYRGLEIEQKGDRLVIKESVLMARQFLDRESSYRTDGSESVNKSWSGREERSEAEWKDGKLLIESTMKARNRAMTTLTTLSLSDDGKTLTMLKEMKNPRASFKEKFVFQRIE